MKRPALQLRTQLKTLLIAHSLTPAELARRSGVSRQVLSDWLAGTKPRNLEQVMAVATALNTSIDYLCFGKGAGNSASGEWLAGVFEGRVRFLSPKLD